MLAPGVLARQWQPLAAHMHCCPNPCTHVKPDGVWPVENPEAPEEQWKGANRAQLMVRKVPVTQSTSRMFAGTVVPAIQGTWKEALFNAKPEWIKHMERNAVLDGDGIFLHAQSQDLLAGALSYRYMRIRSGLHQACRMSLSSQPGPNRNISIETVRRQMHGQRLFSTSKR